MQEIEALTYATELLADRAWSNLQRQIEDWNRVFADVPEKPTSVVDSYVIYPEKESTHD